ncbi:MAG: hypothetical protein ISS95_01020 [Candidatus Aenigmarchaeota archaeon]|nr:hypothetical protein [Candidatus Aenigmarchaeota archaeon]
MVYTSKELEIMTLGCVSYAHKGLNAVSKEIIETKATGDIITDADRYVHDGVIEYFQNMGIEALILGEEGAYCSKTPEVAVLLDAIEGTQNFVNDLDCGTNIAIANYKDILQAKDIEAAVVVNIPKNRKYVASRGNGVSVIDCYRKRKPIKKETDLYELPKKRAYIETEEQIRQQEFLDENASEIFGHQGRSIDATGIRLVALVDHNIKAYADFRHATKSWDSLPSALILMEAGYEFTDVFGFKLGEAVLYEKGNPKFKRDGGLNRRIGENFVAANPENHEKFIRKFLPRYLVEFEKTFDELVEERRKVYGGLDQENINLLKSITAKERLK